MPSDDHSFCCLDDSASDLTPPGTAVSGRILDKVCPDESYERGGSLRKELLDGGDCHTVR